MLQCAQPPEVVWDCLQCLATVQVEGLQAAKLNKTVRESLQLPAHTQVQGLQADEVAEALRELRQCHALAKVKKVAGFGAERSSLGPDLVIYSHKCQVSAAW